jgi:protein TonB
MRASIRLILPAVISVFATALPLQVPAQEADSEPAETPPAREVGFDELKNYHPVRSPAPMFPQRDFQDRVEGFVVLKFTVDTSGRTRDIEVTEWKGSRAMNRAAIAAVEKYQYSPLVIDGDVFEVKDVTVKIEFRINSNRR